MFNDLERSIFSDLLDAAYNHLLTEGCNEFCVAVTPDNEDELENLIHSVCVDSDDAETMKEQLGRGVQVFFSDYMLLKYFKRKIEG